MPRLFTAHEQRRGTMGDEMPQISRTLIKPNDVSLLHEIPDSNLRERRACDTADGPASGAEDISMRRYLRQREVLFAVEDGCLVRTVTGGPGDGRVYCQRCRRSTMETVAHAIDETPFEGDGTSGDMIALQEGLPYTHVHVAMGFFKERGLVEVRHRRCYPATQDAYLDAMIEFHALAEKPKSA